MTQLELEVDEPGYYSCWAQSKNGCSGSGGVTWHPSAAAARQYAIDSFNRGYRTWPEASRPTPHTIRVELLVPGADVGAWGSLTQQQRGEFLKYHPWFTNRKATA